MVTPVSLELERLTRRRACVAKDRKRRDGQPPSLRFPYSDWQAAFSRLPVHIRMSAKRNKTAEAMRFIQLSRIRGRGGVESVLFDLRAASACPSILKASMSACPYSPSFHIGNIVVFPFLQSSSSFHVTHPCLDQNTVLRGMCCRNSSRGMAAHPSDSFLFIAVHLTHSFLFVPVPSGRLLPSPTNR